MGIQGNTLKICIDFDPLTWNTNFKYLTCAYKTGYVAHLHSYMEVVVELANSTVTHSRATEGTGLWYTHSSLVSPLTL